MRKKIILSAVEVLDNLGVKFTIDDIKDKLNISKKTVYKYFASKEELAQASFYYIIEKSKQKQKNIMSENKNISDKVILCLLEYMEIYRLKSEKIFNLYSLNMKLKADIEEKVNENWGKIIEIYHCAKNDDSIRNIDDKLFRIIIEGIFQKIYHQSDRVKIGYDCIKAIL